MIEQDWQKRALRIRREHRDLPNQGWEFVGEGGGNLWELHRGCRIGYIITDVRIAASGTEFWVKTRDATKTPAEERAANIALLPHWPDDTYDGEGAPNPDRNW